MRPADKSIRQAGCGSPEHTLHRRLFLEGTAAGAASIASFSGLFNVPAFAKQAERQGKKCILLWLCGGPSQFETWDPKPGRPTAGPFAAIPTNVPGMHVSELMPRCATIMDKLAVIRSMKTECRITKAVFSTDGQRLYLAGPQGQPGPKDGEFPAFGRLDVFELET